MPVTAKPARRPHDPRFSCGPVKKHPGWSLDALSGAAISRSHRHPAAKGRIYEALQRTLELLEAPAGYRAALLGGSDTGAMEAAMWSLLGARGVDVFSWDVFGQRWLKDVRDELKIEDLRVFEAPYGAIPDLKQAGADRDIVFTWNATAAGARVPDADWISANRQGLTICDATSAAFALPIDLSKIDVLTFSWQKAMGGEAQHGMIVVSPRVIERLNAHRPPWPVPGLYQLFKNGAANMEIYEGSTLNTPSLLCVEDYLSALRWGARIGGLSALNRRTLENFAALKAWADGADWIDWLCADEAARSPVSVTFKFAEPEIAALPDDAQWALSRRIVSLLERENAALDIIPHPAARPGLRIWCGPTVEAEDVAALGPWLDWAYEEARKDF
ncbi:MAG: phosphoserine transaminase [Maricaulaceae bacterium]|nr:phosphoserine transaminase [Maricaulaceae bacterium]